MERSPCPKAHHSSNYAAHLGKHRDFEAKLAVLLDGYEARLITGKAQQQAQKKLLNYYQTNAYRMHYAGYRQRGLQIGSGAIQAVHRRVVQSRLKLSAQRWSRSGAQNVLNLRVLRMSGKWCQLQHILRAA